MMSCGAISPSRSRRPAVPWNASEAACSCALSFSRSVFSPITIAPACCRGTSVDAEPRGEHRQAEDEGAGEQREGAVRQARGDLGLGWHDILLLGEEASLAAVPGRRSGRGRVPLSIRALAHLDGARPAAIRGGAG